MNKEVRQAFIDHLEVRVRELEQSAEPDGYKDVIAKDRALIAALKKQAEEPPPPPNNLLERIELRSYMEAYSQGKSVGGAEKELNEGLGLDLDTQIPWEALAPEARAEDRTDDPTAITIGDWGKTINALLPRIFEKTDAGFLGISTPGVSSGTTTYPVMTGGTTASMKAANAEIEADVATFSVVNVTPTRLSARYLWNMEGIASMGGMLETALRSDLRMVMGDQFDEQLINGNGTSPNVSGLFQELTDPTNPSAEATYDDYRTTATAELDGKMARTESDIRILMGLSTWKHARGKTNTDKQLDAIEAMTRLGASVQNSARIPDVASKRQDAILTFEPGAAVAPIWQGITMIRDPYTNAAKAQVALTAHMLFGFALKRKDGWKQIRFQVEA